MSMKYIDTMKNSRWVHTRLAELIGSYSFSITHTKVIVEDCVFRCPSHQPEPTQAELDMEKDWEPDPPPHLNLEILAAKSAKLQVRPERICHLEEEQICMNMMFGMSEVQVSWERTELHEDEPPDWEEELNITINKLHQEHNILLVSWEHKWEWLQSGEDYPRSYHDKEEAEIYYSDKEESEIYYSDTESMLGAAGDDNSDEKTVLRQRAGTPPDHRPGSQDELGLQHNKRWSLRNNTGTSEECEHKQRPLPVHHLRTNNQSTLNLR